MTSETLHTDGALQGGDLLGAGLPPANDRMLTTCFLAALLHGIIILGVTFSSTGGSSADQGAPGLEVVLVNERAPAAAKNPDARYLSQRTQLGSGNTLKRERSLIPKSSLMPLDRLGVPSGEGLDAQRAGADTGAEDLVATHSPVAEDILLRRFERREGRIRAAAAAREKAGPRDDAER